MTNAEATDRLIAAVRSNDTKGIAESLRAGADVHTGNDLPLRDAAQRRRHEAVRLLLDAGANPRAENSAALRFAAKEGDDLLAKLLLGAGADPHTPHALDTAAFHGHTAVLTTLLDAGADPSAHDGMPVCNAALNGHRAIVTLLLQLGAKVHPNALCFAAEQGFLEIVTDLLATNTHDKATIADAIAKAEASIASAPTAFELKRRQTTLEALRAAIEAAPEPPPPPSA